MYELGGCAYVYFIYGIHHCFNVVTEKKFTPEAVLIRALEPMEGIEEMKVYKNTGTLKSLTSGPGKLTKALQIDRVSFFLRMEIS